MSGEDLREIRDLILIAIAPGTADREAYIPMSTPDLLRSYIESCEIVARDYRSLEEYVEREEDG